MNGKQPVGAPDPTDPLANPVPAQRIPDPTPEDFLNWVHERFGSYIQEQPPARVPPPKMTGGQVWDLQHATGPLQQLMTERLLMKDPAYRDYMTKQAAYEEHQKQLGQIAPLIGAETRTQGMLASTEMKSQAALERLGYKWVVDQNGENVLVHVGLGQQMPVGAPQTSGQPPINMASPSPTPEPSMKVRPGTPSNVSQHPGETTSALRMMQMAKDRSQGVSVTRTGVYSASKPPQYQLGTNAQGASVWLLKPGQTPPAGAPAYPETVETGAVKPPTTEQETFKRSSSVLKLRIQQARSLIESNLGESRGMRALQGLATHDPTGWASGSDFAANAATYNSYINEIGSLLRTLYGAVGIRSYQEIVRLINTMPPWASGPQRIKQQFDALDAAVSTADNEMRQVRPDLFAGEPSQVAPRPSSGNPILDEAMKRADEKRRQRTGAP